jgi:site-specific DNA recombinase
LRSFPAKKIADSATRKRDRAAPPAADLRGADHGLEALRQSQKEKAEYHRRAIEKLHTQYSKLQKRIDQIYLDKLDGEIAEAFYRRNVSAWREQQARIRARIESHEKADQNYIEQGIRLLDLARNAHGFYRNRGQAERAALVGFILPGSTLEADRVVPAFEPPFDIIHRIAQDTKKQAASLETTCPVRLPRQDSNLRPKD